MKPARRGLLRAFGVGALAGVAPTREIAPGVGTPLPFLPPPMTGFGSPIVGTPQNWSLFNATAKPAQRKRRREEIAAALRGGMPPHMASCHSWAPWFRAQRAAAWIEAREAEHDDWFTALRRRIVGDE